MSCNKYTTLLNRNATKSVNKLELFASQFCGMTQHMGEILHKVFKDTGLKVAPVARKMGIDRGTVYRHFDERELSLDYIARYGKAMGVDMRKYFPQIADIANEELTQYISSKPSYQELERTVDYWKDKYIKLLEQYNELLLDKI